MSERDAFEKLQRALRFEPSPDFETKVRERIRRAPTPGAGWLSWQPAMWAAAAAILALVSVSVWRGQVEALEPIAVVSSAVTPQVVVKPGFTFDHAVNSTTKPGFKASRTSQATVEVVAIPPAAPEVPEVPEVIVSPDQAIALNGFLASLRTRSSTHAASVGAPVETDPVPEPEETGEGTKPPKPGPAPPLGPPIPAIVIVPIKIELLTPAGSGGGTSKFAPNR